MHPKKTRLIEKTFFTVGTIAFIWLLTIAAAAIQAFEEGLAPDVIVAAMLIGDVGWLFYPVAAICIGSLWMVLFLRIERGD